MARHTPHVASTSPPGAPSWRHERARLVLLLEAEAVCRVRILAEIELEHRVCQVGVRRGLVGRDANEMRLSSVGEVEHAPLAVTISADMPE